MTGHCSLILGLARQGTALARYLAEQGMPVRISDLRPATELADEMAGLADLPIEYVLGEHPLSLLDGTETLYLSGGVPADAPLVVEARRRGIPLSNDSQVFLDAAPCRVIGVTGSAGKTTTTALLGRMEAAPGRSSKTWVGGNIGNPLLADVHRMGPNDLAVMELSSFQLELMTSSPPVAGVLNITPNHLDRHGTMEAYTAAKARILDFQDAEDVAVLGWDDPIARSLADRVAGECWWFSAADEAIARGCYLRQDEIVLRGLDGETVVAPAGEIRLRGAHNLLNVLAACTLAAVAGIRPQAMRTAIREFAGMPHRLELVRTWRGVQWINDSIATAPERAIAAIQAFDEPLVLLLGGRDKKLPWDDLARRVQRRIKHVIIFGEAADLIEDNLRAAFARKESLPSVPVSEDQGSGDMEFIEGSTAGEAKEPPDPYPKSILRAASVAEAVQLAAEIAQDGDVVLLSPGCTSFDEFKDFEARGERFRELVREL